MSSKTTAPSIQANSISCPSLDGTGLLANGDVFNRTPNQDLSAGRLGTAWPLLFPGGHHARDSGCSPGSGCVPGSDARGRRSTGPLPFEAEVEHDFHEIRSDVAITQTIGRLLLKCRAS